MQRGQTVLEFLFIMLIVIVYLTTLVIPMGKDAQTAISDTTDFSRANNETQKLANAVQKVSLMGNGSRTTVDLFIPQNTSIYCDEVNKKIYFETQVLLKPYPAQCSPTGLCTKIFQMPQALECALAMPGPAKVTTQINKTNGKVIVTSGS